MFALRVIVYTKTQLTPGQLVFEHDSIWNKQKQDLIHKGNQQENCKKKNKRTKKGIRSYPKIRGKEINKDPYLGPYIMTTIRSYVTIRSRKG